MGHSANHEFFVHKREWSKRKDQILEYYLTPYLHKIATQCKPILIVDGFAGPGEFDDGERGSPLIIALAIERAKRKGLLVDARAMLIERDAELADRLTKRLIAFSHCDIRPQSFGECIPEIHRAAKVSSTLLYLDPFTVEGLKWSSLDSLFVLLQQGLSIEILLNFNVDSFCRRGLAAIKGVLPADSNEMPVAEPEYGLPSTIESLTEIIGGDWWIPVLQNTKSYQEKVTEITKGFCKQLRGRFNEVCFYEVREKWQHKVPKYVLVFGSRHPDALLLMNDAMCKAREAFLDQEPNDSNTLFELRPESLVPEPGSLPEIVREVTALGRMTRKSAVCEVIRRVFCLYSSSAVAGEIRNQIKAGEVQSATGKSRIADDVEVWRG